MRLRVLPTLLFIFSIFSVFAFQLQVTQENIFESAPYHYSHAGSLTELKDGTIVVVYHAGSGEKNADCSIYSARRDPKTGVWSTPFKIKDSGVCQMNPTIFQSENGSLYVNLHSGGAWEPKECSTHGWSGFKTASHDGGLTWTPISPLPEGFLGGIKNKCITMSNKQVLCPASTESILWFSHMETTDQAMEHWGPKSNDIMFNIALNETMICQGVIQPTLFEVPNEPGHIIALMRSSCTVIAKAESFDYGATFDDIADNTHIPNPGSGIDGVVMQGQPDLGMILIYNNSPEHRFPLSLAQSSDGKEWKHQVDFGTDPKCSYQYPGIVQGRDPRTAHVIYTLACEGKQRVMQYAHLRFL